MKNSWSNRESLWGSFCIEGDEDLPYRNETVNSSGVWIFALVGADIYPVVIALQVTYFFYANG
ncbi:hypothetical protein ACFFHM_12575 [Halalkalibacter kiskunsagensis]|uniref:Uncharacterized protein n=1 Tax=Halalkalibacter kiskunsagensis TaxID=1548599 RepID=A0ABV6KGY8_9BACI